MDMMRQQFIYKGVTYQQRFVLCGKKACGKCPHGPYWYAIVPTPIGKPAVRYVGKELKGPAKEYLDNQSAMEVVPE